MNRSRLFDVVSISSFGLVVLLGACELDMGSPDEPEKGSGGADAGAPRPPAPAPSPATGAADGGTPPVDSTAPRTASWTAPPEGVLVPLNSAGNEKCSFRRA